MLSAEKLQEIRVRAERSDGDHRAYHNVLLAQSDRALLLQHIDDLTRRLAAAESEKSRLRRSLE
jgi:hypothetical protein